MRGEVSDVSYIFWKVNLLLSTISRINDILEKMENNETLDSEEEKYLKNAPNILKSIKYSIEDINSRLSTLQDPFLRNYFGELLTKVKVRTEEIEEKVKRLLQTD